VKHAQEGDSERVLKFHVELHNVASDCTSLPPCRLTRHLQGAGAAAAAATDRPWASAAQTPNPPPPSRAMDPSGAPHSPPPGSLRGRRHPGGEKGGAPHGRLFRRCAAVGGAGGGASPLTPTPDGAEDGDGGGGGGGGGGQRPLRR